MRRAGPDNITLGTGHTPTETGQTREGVWVVCPAYRGQGYVGSGGREQSRLFECHYLYQWHLGGSVERREGKKPSTELVDWPTSDHLCLFCDAFPHCAVYSLCGGKLQTLPFTLLLCLLIPTPTPPLQCIASIINLFIPLSLSCNPTFTFLSSHFHFLLIPRSLFTFTLLLWLLIPTPTPSSQLSSIFSFYYVVTFICIIHTNNKFLNG